MALPPAFAASALYDSLLQSALKRFLARATLELEASLTDSSISTLSIEPTDDPCELVLRWFGTRHILHVPRAQPFTAHELRVARAIGEVLSARYQSILDPSVLATRADLFQGLIEDRYVAAFLDRRPYRAGTERNRADRLANCIEVLRVAALSSYESHAISSGVLVLGDDAPHPRHQAARLYGQPLTAAKSFYRLCDGVRTVFLIGEDGLLLDIIDITHRAREIHPMMAITSPCPSAYRQHAAATLGTRDTCIVLSPSHEIKVFAEGALVFTFRNAEWHLLDVEAKYVQWLEAVGSRPIAEKLFQCALDMADARQGALLVVLRDAEAAGVAGRAHRSPRPPGTRPRRQRGAPAPAALSAARPHARGCRRDGADGAGQPGRRDRRRYAGPADRGWRHPDASARGGQRRLGVGRGPDDGGAGGRPVRRGPQGEYRRDDHVLRRSQPLEHLSQNRQEHRTQDNRNSAFPSRTGVVSIPEALSPVLRAPGFLCSCPEAG